jgi:hypothetical protein
MTEVSIVCLDCEKLVKFEVDAQGLADWHNGILLQHALPELEAPLREMMITKLCPVCSERLFSWGDE